MRYTSPSVFRNADATCGMAIDIGAKAIVVSSISGRTVRMVSRFRVPTDIVGMATSRAVWYKLALSWGVQPVLGEHFESTDVLFYHARKAAKQALHLAPGDRIVLTGGTVNGTPLQKNRCPLRRSCSSGNPRPHRFSG